MSKSVVVVSSTMCKGGNSELLAEEFAKGARESGNHVEMIYLRDLEIRFCFGCLACQTVGNCVIDDGASKVMEKIRSADVLVFSTPVYYYAMCGQLKTFLDRMNPIYAAGHIFKEVYLLATAADTEPAAMDGAIKEIQGWIDCFEGVRLAGVVRGNGVDRLGAIKEHADILKEAYRYGKMI